MVSYSISTIVIGEILTFFELCFSLFTTLYTLSVMLYFIRMGQLACKLPILSNDDNDSANTLPFQPKISIIIAAKNEQDNIAACVESLLKQNYLNFEIVIVNDRSDDNTKYILNDLCNKHPSKVKAVHITSVPKGWGGQNYAINCGVENSLGEWICLTDADCAFISTSILMKSLAYALAEESPFISILPELSTYSRWEKFYLPVFSFVHAMRLGILQVNNKQSCSAYANGAFMLLKKESYKALGGHEAVKSVINDDTRLANIAKQKNIKIRLVGSRNLIKTQMYSTPSSSWSGWVRNSYSTQYEGTDLLTSSLCLLYIALLPWLVMGALALLALYDIEKSNLLLIWIVPLLASHLYAALVFKSLQFSTPWSLLYFFSSMYAFAILVRSTIKLWFKKSICWHGVVYDAPKKHDKY